MTDQKLEEIRLQQVETVTLLKGITERLDRNSKALFGDGGQVPGMLTRVDRLEQNAERSRWAIRSLVGAVLSLGLTALWGFLRGKS